MAHAILDEYWNAGPATFISRYGRHFFTGALNAGTAWAFGTISKTEFPATWALNTFWSFTDKYFINYQPIQ